MAQLFRNNAFSSLGASLTNVATTLTVTAGHGDRFPVVAAPDFMLLTLQDASNNIEIVKVTARTSGSDSMTIQRAQEGTSARAWSIGDVVELRLTASALGPLSLLEGASTAASIRTILDVPTRTGGDASGTWNISITGNAATATTTTGNAATATKLQTARTINGTSFDGSANITTANWGTARTITIGNTGKSVDGSANVSWSLAEILGIGVPETAQELGGGVDLNTIQTPGFYVQSQDVEAASGTNYPIPYAGALTVLKNASGVTQIYCPYGSFSGLFIRALYNGSWSPWRGVYHTGNLGAASETASGIVELATTAEAQALASATLALTPARLADAFKGANQSLSSSGYQKLPNGLILQWGTITGIAYNATGQTFAFPISFPTACLGIVSKGYGSVGVTNFVDVNILAFDTGGVSNYQACSNFGSGTLNFRWLAIGY